jgi:hypothetical protein
MTGQILDIKPEEPVAKCAHCGKCTCNCEKCVKNKGRVNICNACAKKGTGKP